LADFLDIYGWLIATVIMLVVCFSVRKHPKASRIALTFCVFCCAAAFFGPALYTVYWHVRHNNREIFEDKIVHVPLRWVVSLNQPDGSGGKLLDIDKLPLNLVSAESTREPEGLIFLKSKGFPLKANSEETLEYWQNLLWSAPNVAGRVVTGPLRVKSGSQDVACMETTDDSRPEWSFVSCLFLESGWTADFGGSRKDVDTFLDVIRNISPADVARGD
jgi:hypothetical protein